MWEVVEPSRFGTGPSGVTPRFRVTSAADTITLAGRLAFDTASACLKAVTPLLAVTNLPVTVDLSSVEHCDSAGLALLLEFERQALARAGHVHYVGAPPRLAGLVGFFGLEPLLHLNAR